MLNTHVRSISKVYLYVRRQRSIVGFEDLGNLKTKENFATNAGPCVINILSLLKEILPLLSVSIYPGK